MRAAAGWGAGVVYRDEEPVLEWGDRPLEAPLDPAAARALVVRAAPGEPVSITPPAPDEYFAAGPSAGNGAWLLKITTAEAFAALDPLRPELPLETTTAGGTEPVSTIDFVAPTARGRYVVEYSGAISDDVLLLDGWRTYWVLEVE